MSWINRSIVRIGSALAALVFVSVAAALADAPLRATYGQQTIQFTHLSSQAGNLAIGVQDRGFARLLADVGAVMTWKPGHRYVLITTAVPQVVSFAVGDRRYDVGPISLEARFAPFEQGNEVYLPFDEVLRALDLALQRGGSTAVLQPQLASLDVQDVGDGVTLVAHGGAPLHPHILRQSAQSVVYAFDGVGTTLAGLRAVNAGGVRSVQITQTGTLRNPTTVVTVRLLPGATTAAPRSNDGSDAVLGFSGPGASAPSAVAQVVAPAQTPSIAATPMAQPEPSATGSAGPALVSGITAQPTADGSSVTIAIAGNATFAWHRLRDPDNRFWIDISGAQLQGPPMDQTEPDPLVSLRVRQIDPTTVRVALSLAGPKSLDISPSAGGLTIAVGREDDIGAAPSGSGSVGSVVAIGEAAVPVTPAPLGESGGTSAAGWKFGARSTYVPTNPRLIVIDPGHGGSDPGSERNGLEEKVVTLDMSKRLRDILIARGWQVQMTHDTDVDVYAPNDSAKQELQARVDVADNAGARLFVSIHANAYINSGPYGTTTYISKSEDVPLARAIERSLRQDGTKDDGIIKSHLYVTLHTEMPAVLIETAFLSNPGDFALLDSPAWRQKVAEEIADGIDRYARQYPIPNQPGE